MGAWFFFAALSVEIPGSGLREGVPKVNKKGSDPLWRVLQQTANVLAATDCGASGTDAVLRTPLAMRAAVQAQAFLAWRHWGHAQSVVNAMVAKPPSPWSIALLRLGIVLLADASSGRSHFTLVDQVVEACKRMRVQARYANLLNAVLRGYLRERDSIELRMQNEPVAKWNFPAWWVNRVRKDYPDAWESILWESNRAAPMVLRVNRRFGSSADYANALAARGLAAHCQDLQAIVMDRPVAVNTLPGFEQGYVSVQDSAAQMAVQLLLGDFPVPKGRSLRVLDACAAPGGKTLHLAEFGNVDVLALEIDPERAQRIGDNLRRAEAGGLADSGASVTIKVGSALEPQAWWDGGLFDAILLDAPCTASGIVRRHPDIRWLRRESDIEQLSAVQAGMLNQLWPLLKQGGRFLYSTCSVFQREGEEQARAFMLRHADASRLPAPGHILPHTTSAGVGQGGEGAAPDRDGFFLSLFEKL